MKKMILEVLALHQPKILHQSKTKNKSCHHKLQKEKILIKKCFKTIILKTKM